VHNPDDPKDDLRAYRHASASPSWPVQREPVCRPQPSQDEQRAKYAEQVARSEFGRFYWNGQMGRRLIAAMRRRPRENRDKPNGKQRR